MSAQQLARNVQRMEGWRDVCDDCALMVCVSRSPTDSQGPKMDRMKIIKRRLSMSLRSARPVDDSLSELAEQMALDEPSTARDNGESDGDGGGRRAVQRQTHSSVTFWRL